MTISIFIPFKIFVRHTNNSNIISLIKISITSYSNTNNFFILLSFHNFRGDARGDRINVVI